MHHGLAKRQMSEDVMRNIRDNLAKAVFPAAGHERPHRPPETEAASRACADSEILRQVFIAEAEALSAHVHSPGDQSEAMDILLGIVRACGAELVLAWDEAQLPIPGISEKLLGAGVRVLDTWLPDDKADRAAHLMELAQAEVGITGALAGIADTGSLALIGGPGRARLASLLPPVHIALLSVSNLYPHMAAFFSDHSDVVRDTGNLVFISGPSRTADIEQTLTLGVHGPRDLHIILIPSGAEVGD
jgi:L-lactate dehydrogenase complex protein LldG